MEDSLFKRSAVVILALMCVFVIGWEWNTGPSKQEVLTSFQNDLPAYWKVDDFKISVTENVGTKVDPLVRSRFHATVKLTIDLYAPASKPTGVPKEFLVDLNFVEKVSEVNKKIDIFGISNSKKFADTWKTSFSYEVNPIPSLGNPIAAFQGQKGKLLVRNSEEENAYFSKLSGVAKANKDKMLNLMRQKGSVSGEASDAKKIWPFTITYTSIDEATGKFLGTVEWHNLNSISKMNGEIHDLSMAYIETEFIKKGTLGIGCKYEYSFLSQTSKISGKWGQCYNQTGNTFIDLK